jgi:hypothetical protein
MISGISPKSEHISTDWHLHLRNRLNHPSIRLFLAATSPGTTDPGLSHHA